MLLFSSVEVEAEAVRDRKMGLALALWPGVS